MTWENILKVIQIPKVNLNVKDLKTNSPDENECGKVWDEINKVVEQWIDKYFIRPTVKNNPAVFLFKDYFDKKYLQIKSSKIRHDTEYGWEEWQTGNWDRRYLLDLEINSPYNNSTERTNKYILPYAELMCMTGGPDFIRGEEASCKGLILLAENPWGEMIYHSNAEDESWGNHKDFANPILHVSANTLYNYPNPQRDAMSMPRLFQLQVTMAGYKSFQSRLTLQRVENIVKEIWDSVHNIARDWYRNAEPRSFKKSEEHPLGPITEYHGTVDIVNVLKEGIRGSSPKNRSKRHVPEKLRKVKRITYTSDNPEEAIKFAERRARFLKIPEDNIGVIGVRGRDLVKPIIHNDIIMEGETFVREGGIPAKYLERV